ncbi:LysR family transcriptional regulator [Arthrobacter sp. G119Y2]|uniref:LysR family transcriptional regulator n=1 Tax=Arthrobacter sp. G119Y2 TaxID=3134965 RepID=UPI00311A91DB
MDVHQLRMLRELGERGSLAAVARAFHVSPSAVSQQLTALQRRVEVPLTERRGRNLVLTGAGQALAEAAVQISVAMSSAEQAVSRYVQDPTATVKICAFNSAALTYFGPLLGDLAGEGNPRLVCHDRDVGQDAFPALAADYDLVIAHRLEHSAPWPSSLTVLPLVREPLDVAMSDQHPLAGQSTVGVGELIDEEWVSVQDGFPLVSALHSIAVHAGKPLNITHRINEFFVAATIIANSSAVALMPRYTAAPQPGSGIVLKPLRDVHLSRHVDILCRPESLHRTAVQKVLRTLQNCAAPTRANGKDAEGTV